MYYLSRTPNPNDQTTTNTFSNLCKNSVFSISDSGTFEDISIIKVSNISDIDTPWEWFAYESSSSSSPSRKQLQAVVVPRNPSLNIQVITVLPTTGLFLCALIVPGSRPFAHLCIYSPQDNLWNTSSRMNGEIRNPMVSAAAIIDAWLYLAGGHMGNPSYVEQIAYLNSAERMNLYTGEWETLPPMQKTRSSAVGVAYKGKYFVAGGSNNDPRSAEIYNPATKTWLYIEYFLPSHTDGFAMGALDQHLLLVSWSDRLGVKVWSFTGLIASQKTICWRLVGFLPDQEERIRLKKYGARLVRAGKELWLVFGESNNGSCQVSGTSTWPTFPGPSFKPDVGRSILPKGHIYALSFGYKLNWRKIPVYSI